MKRKILLLLLVCAFLVGCTQKEQAGVEQPFTVSGGPNLDGSREDTMTLSMRVPETLNPILNREESVDRILKLLYLPLLDFDESGKAVPSVATSWQISEDGRTIVLPIRTDLTWADGSSLTADDVVFTFQMIRNAPEDSVYKRVLDYVSGCQKIGDSSVMFTFYETFSGNLSVLRFPILSAAYYAGQNDPQSQVNMTPLGNGAYAMLSYVQASELMLERNAHYHGALATIPYIRVKLTAGEETDVHSFEQGITDVLAADAMEAGRYIDDGVTGIYQYPSNEYDFIGFNFNRSLFQDKALRQAVAYALPKENLMDSVYLQYGTLTNTPISPKSWLYEENVVPYNHDLTIAATYLKNSGWIDENGNGRLAKTVNGQSEPLSAVILVNGDNMMRRQIASKLKEELESIGFSITIDQQPFAQYQEKFINGQFDLVVGSWKCSEIIDLTPFFGTGGSLNYIGYSNEEVDRLLLAAHDAVSEGATLLAYSSLQKKLAEELPYISIVYQNRTIFTSKYVGGEISPTDFNIYRNIENWTYERKAGE